MTTMDTCALAGYRPVALVNNMDSVTLVQQTATGKFYVRKELTVYDASVYRYLMEHHVRGTPQIVEAAEQDGKLIVIEEYISGQTLRAILDDGNLFPVEDALRITERICTIVKDLHSASPPIVHRDIKPSNVIITSDGGVRLLDMNAAKWMHEEKTEDTALLGTVGYAAPEQYGFGTSTVQTDIYSAGVLLCELLTGRLPKDGLPPGKPGKIVRKCTQIDPKNRYMDMQDLLDALAACHGQTTVPQSPYVKNRFLPPGFRTGRPTNMLIALCAYIALLNLSLTYKAENLRPGLMTWVERIVYLVWGMFILLFTGNYLNMWSFLKINRISSTWLRLLAVVIFDIILIFSMLMFMILIAGLMGGSVR